MKLLSLFIISFFIALLPASAQSGTDSATAAGGKFNASHSRAFWMGANYRKEWNTPIKVPVFNLATEHGGLTPVKRGGGKQTKSLRLEDPKGREYTLRSIAKFITSKTLPGDLQSEAAADLVSDGVSASYPYASLSIPVLAEAAGIPHGSAKLVYIPDDPKLGEFRKDFANMLALYEERLPDTVAKGYNTDELVEKLEKDNDNDVNQAALLRIRILDFFVMDLDRHEGQWTWGAYDNVGKGRTFYPIAKDRDQAFYINQGLLPGFVRGKSLVPQLEGFKAKSKDITRFNFASRNLDRFFLNELSEQDWQQAVDQFIPKMTDEVIDRALAQQPAEIRGMPSAARIAATLKQRRNYLAAEVMKYYHFLSEIVNITGSDKKELFDITRNDDGSVQVQVYKTNKEGEKLVKMYDRKFDPAVTKELRLYGFDGDDKFLVHGNNDKIKIRMIGGGGQDVFENSGKSEGGFVYDKRSGNNTVTGSFKNKMSNDSLINSFQRIYYKYNETSPFISGAYNKDDGIFLGFSLKTIRHGFRKTPYKTMNKISVNRAFATGSFNFHYENEFIGALGTHTDFLSDIEIRAPKNTSNFFGYGVNSVFTKSKKVDYYRTRYNLGIISFLIRHNFSPKVTMTVGPVFEYYDLNKEDNLKKNIILTPPPGLNYTTLFHHQFYAGGQISLFVDTRDNKVLPSKGLTWQATIRNLNGLNDSSYNVTQLNSNFSFYVNLSPDRLTFADQFGGGINLGNGYEFYQAQYLGNEENLRGYRKNRFAGKSRLYNQAELRLRLANFKTYLFPGSLGLFAFFDAGTVWHPIDTKTKLLTGYGGGFWFSPLRRILLYIAYAVSADDKTPMVGFGWNFGKKF